ncbi:MAG: hypothetical protein E6K39_16480 [Gammaproteobacteria bacterium]|nr:MAG: hypothetical protein DMF76_22895 [Acidobacteriota bacterium]TLZ02179.1 MAG: hypothetical protein E6K39_16480 [Gammaproteobacteria bacterium]
MHFIGLNSVDPNEVETLHTGRLCPSKNVENCGNKLILRCSGSEHGGTSRFASNLIGDSPVLRAKHSCRSSRSRAFSRSGHDSTSEGVSYRHVTESAVMASEIEQLVDLQGFLKLASNPA